MVPSVPLTSKLPEIVASAPTDVAPVSVKLADNVPLPVT